MGKVLAVCISEKKGTQKKMVGLRCFGGELGAVRGCSCRKVAPAGESSFR